MKEERIDNYILGRMSDEERNSFEHEMAEDIELRQEVELRKDIVRALRMERDRELLQSIEQGIKAKERRRKTFAITRYVSIGTVAACLAIGVFVHFETASTYSEYGMDIELPVSRGGGNADKVAEAINGGNYDRALEIIEEGESYECWRSGDPDPVIQEQLTLEHKIEQDDLRWYKAVTYMRMGKYFKAKKLLKQIAASDSHHKAEAQKALDELSAN